MDYHSKQPEERLAHFSETVNNNLNSTTDNNNISAASSAISKKNGNISGGAEMVPASEKAQLGRNLTDRSHDTGSNIRSGENPITKSNEESGTNPNIEDTPVIVTGSIDEDQSATQQMTHQVQTQATPLATNNRSILILREIEANVPESSVREIFNSENCPTRPVHCEYALQNSWYVTFKNDEDACLALAYIRKHVTWNGHPVMARIKPKPAVPSAVNQPPSIHHHHHQIVPTMVMHQIGGVPQVAATDVSMTTTAATTITQQAISNGETNAQADPLAENSQPSYAMSAAQSTVSAQHDTPVAGLDQQNSSIPAQQNHHQPSAYSIPQATSPRMVNMSGNPNHLVQPHHLPGAPQHYGYSAVAYYSQHGPVMTPWQYTNGPQYDLSEVFVYNGLAPYPSAQKSSNQKLHMQSIAGSTTVSSAALLGAPSSVNEASLSYQNQHHSQHHQHHHNHRNSTHQQQRHQTNNHHYPQVNHSGHQLFDGNSVTNHQVPFNVPHQSQQQGHSLKNVPTTKGSNKSNRNK